MAFSVASLGPFFLFLVFIPRVAGSMRTIRLSASDLATPFQLNQIGTGNSSSAFLSFSAPGFFLDLQLITNSSLLKVYGHKRAGPSLYGVRLAPGGAEFQIVDGYDPSIPTLLESVPSCLFSLALDGQVNHPLELHNLYDRRFSAYGEITFSFVEYIFEDDVPTCPRHLRSSDRNSALLRRDGDVPTSSFPTQSPSSSGPTASSQRHTGLNSKMDVLIGLISALITIVVVIFFVAIFYMMRLRRQEDPEARAGKINLANKSTTLVSATATETIQLQSQDKSHALPKDRYIIEPQTTMLSDPTSSFSTRVELTKTGPKADTSSVVSAVSRSRSRNDPPTSPPKEPVPDLPKPPPRLASIQPVRGGDTMLEAPTSSSFSPVYSRGQRKAQGTQYSTGEAISQTSRRIDRITPDRPGPAHIRSQSSSDNSTSSHESRPSRFSKPLPELRPETLLFAPTSPSQINAHPPHSNRNTNERSRRTDPSRQPGSELQVGAHGQMRTIRESDAGFDSDHSSPQLAVSVPPKRSTHGRTGSIADVQQKDRSQALPYPRNLRGSKSSPEFEKPDPVGDIRWRGVIQPISSQDREALKLNTRRAQPSRGRGESMENKDERRRLSLKIPADPDDWFSLSHDRVPDNVSGNKRSQTAMQHATRLRISEADTSPQRTRQGGAGTVEFNRHQPPNKRNNNLQTIWPQPPRYEETTSLPRQHLSAQPLVIAPLSTHKRALPKPPV